MPSDRYDGIYDANEGLYYVRDDGELVLSPYNRDEFKVFIEKY